MSDINLDVLFRQILKPALGCTEPVAVALASAAAYHALSSWTPDSPELQTSEVALDEVQALDIRVSNSIFKNSFAIAIPNSGGHKGLVMSAALGLFCDPRKGLRVFEDLLPLHVDQASSFVANQHVRVSVAEDVPEVFIQIEVRTADRSGRSLIRNEHSSVSCLWRDGEVIWGNPEPETSAHVINEVDQLKTLQFQELVELVEHLPDSVMALIRTTVEKNVDACRAGIEHPMGIGTGYFGEQNSAMLSHQVASLTAAGSDARMSGYPVEIMSSAGSGNQGITATIPIVAYAHGRLIDESRMLKAVALSHLVTMYLTCYLGYLSALCGVAMKAGIGAACGLTYLMGGTVEDIERAVKIMAATLTGMICDGAKAGCALKVSIAADMALRAATLAIRKANVPDDNGIVAATADDTIRNLVVLNRSMAGLDHKIIEIMLSKVTV